MTSFLGIDGGGSRTRFLLVDETDREIARIETGPSNWVTVGPEESRQAIAAGIAQLPAVPDIVGAGFAGAGRPSARTHYEEVLQTLLPRSRVFVETDAEVACTGAFRGEAGTLLIVGTGSIVVGRRADGTTFRRGGWGPHFGDEGSGFWIGREVVCEALRSRDCGDPGGLEDRVARSLGLDSIEDLIDAWGTGRISVSDIASLAAWTLSEYPVEPAGRIIAAAAAQLRGLVDEAMPMAGSSRLSAAGSIATHPQIQQLIGRVFEPPAAPPERGAILWAQRQMNP